MGVPFVNAPCEAEAQCAELAEKGKVSAFSVLFPPLQGKGKKHFFLFSIPLSTFFQSNLVLTSSLSFIPTFPLSIFLPSLLHTILTIPHSFPHSFTLPLIPSSQLTIPLHITLSLTHTLFTSHYSSLIPFLQATIPHSFPLHNSLSLTHSLFTSHYPSLIPSSHHTIPHSFPLHNSLSLTHSLFHSYPLHITGLCHSYRGHGCTDIPYSKITSKIHF